MIRNIEVGKVEESGHVAFFEDISLEAKGQTTQQIAQRVIDAVEKKSGRRPTSIGVVRIPANDPERATRMMMQVYQLRKRGCRVNVPPYEAPELLNDVNRIAWVSLNR